MKVSVAESTRALQSLLGKAFEENWADPNIVKKESKAGVKKLVVKLRSRESQPGFHIHRSRVLRRNSFIAGLSG